VGQHRKIVRSFGTSKTLANFWISAKMHQNNKLPEEGFGWIAHIPSPVNFFSEALAIVEFERMKFSSGFQIPD